MIDPSTIVIHQLLLFLRVALVNSLSVACEGWNDESENLHA